MKIINILKKIRWFFNYLSWLWSYARLRLGFNTLRDIKILSIEFSSVCNLRCRYCYLERGERAKLLDIHLYEKLIKEVAENPKYRIRTMEWPISGEFFMYPDYKKVFEITKKYMDANPWFEPHVILNENFMLFNEERIEDVLRSGVVKQIICSFDGHDAESFERMRPPAKFDVCLSNFRKLAQRNRELGHPVHLQLNNGRDDESVGKEWSAPMREILNTVDDATFWRPEPWNESFNKPQRSYDPALGFCTFVFNNVTLSSDGFISKCCMDLKGATRYADLSENTLEAIWHSKIRQGFLNAMFRNQRGALSGCRSCSITNTNNDNRYNNFWHWVKRARFNVQRRRGVF